MSRSTRLLVLATLALHASAAPGTMILANSTRSLAARSTEEFMDTPSMSALLSEFLGTFTLVFTVGANVLASTPSFAGISIACSLMVMIYALGGISGANFNPAVSFGLMLSKMFGGPGMGSMKFAYYAGVQLAAGAAASLAAQFVVGKGKGKLELQPADMGKAALCELLYTFMLVFVVMNVAVANKNVPALGGTANQYYGLAIGFVIVAGAYGAGQVSGGCFNPAVALGVAIAGGNYMEWAVYTGVQLAGAALAIVAYKTLRPGDFGSKSNLPVKLISEFLGTYFLVLTVGLNVNGKDTNNHAAVFSIAASLMCMIYALGDVSGAHFNPAVSGAIYITNGGDVMELAKYMGAQTLGGIAAACTFMYIAGAGAFGPVGGNDISAALVAETWATMVLAFVVLATAVSSQTKSTDMFGLAIASTITVGGYAVGGVSGGSLNPAVSIGLATAGALNGNSDSLVNAAMYSAAEFAGGAIAAFAAKTTHADL